MTRARLGPFASITVIALAAANTAFAHGASGQHESPQWCGTRIAVLGDAGLVIADGPSVRTIAIPAQDALHAWSPSCDRIAIAGERVVVVDVASGTARDLGPIPRPFERAHRRDGTLPTIRFSSSGAHFAIPVAAHWRNEEAVFVYDAASGVPARMDLPSGEVHAVAMLGEDTVVAAVTPGGIERPVRLFRATEHSHAAVNNVDYRYARLSFAPVVAAVMTETGDVRTVDITTGAERAIAAHGGYVRAISADATHLLYATENGAGSVAAPSGPPAPGDGPRAMELSMGITADEQLGMNSAGTFGVIGDGSRLVFDDGHRPGSPRTLADLASATHSRGGITHVSISPDGAQIAFLYSVTEPRPAGTHAPRCEFDGWTRVELYVVPIATRIPRRVAFVSHQHSCGVE